MSAEVTSPDRAAAPEPYPLATILRDKGLQRVALVDDYYDRIEEYALGAADADDLWKYLEFAPEALAELAALDHPMTKRSDLSGGAVATFLANIAKCPNFDTAWKKSLAGTRRVEQAGQLGRITAHLREMLGLTVEGYGRDVSVETLVNDGVQLLFLDWFLGDDADDPVEVAVQKAKDLHGNWPDDRPRPLIILMSSQPSVRDRAEEFRQRSRLVAGMFHAVPKSELGNAFSLQMHLQTLAMSLPAGHNVQAFVEALQKQVRSIGDDFVERISALTLSDYAYIQSLSLQEDGQPLGDYLMWLFSAYFGHLLFGQALREQRDLLDASQFTTLPFQTRPSPQLAKMYHTGLFDTTVGPVAGHPHVKPIPASDEDDGGSASQAADVHDPMLTLGDIFVAVASDADSNVGANGGGQRSEDPSGGAATDTTSISPLPELLMIINAQCDLAFTPEGSRSIEPSRSILLLPGNLHPIWATLPDRYRERPRTELYEHNGQSYRILWNAKEVKSIPYGAFHQWCNGEGIYADDRVARYERMARLRLPYALEVQRAFTADLTRIGMPVAPPIYQPISIDLFKIHEKVFESAEAAADGEEVSLVLSRKKEGMVQQCVLTLPLVKRLQQILRDSLAALDKQKEQGEAPDAEPPKIAALRRALDNYSAWAKLLEPIAIPTGASPRTFVGGHVQIVRGKAAGDASTSDKPAVVVVSLRGS